MLTPARRHLGTPTLSSMSRVDWPLAVSVAASFSGRYPLENTYHQTRLERDLPELVARASDLVSEETGLEAPGLPDVAVVGRAGWVENNVASFATLLAPAEKRLGTESGVGAAPSAAEASVVSPPSGSWQSAGRLNTTWAFVPLRPKALTQAIRSSASGHDVPSVTTRSGSCSQGTCGLGSSKCSWRGISPLRIASMTLAGE